MSTSQQTILITGATDGIGLELARLYAAQGNQLVLVGRRPLSALSETLFTPQTYCQADLSQADAVHRVLDHLAQQQIEQLDYVIHNAGLGYVGAVEAQPPDNIKTLLQVNTYAPIQLTHALLPLLRQTAGKLVLISSVATALGMADYATYIASKAAINGFARSLRVELQDDVGVQLILPGATRTGMHAKAGVDKAQMDWDRFPSAERVAQKIMRAIASNRRQVVIGGTNRLLFSVGQQFGRGIDTLRSRTVAQSKSDPRRCLITGFADGIGRALALKFAETHHIVGIDVDAERAAVTKADIDARGGSCDIHLCDLTDQGAIAELALDGAFDVVIHNAGISAAGHFAQMTIEEQILVLDLNLQAPLLLTQQLLEKAQLCEGGTLTFISSLSHFVSYPGASVYGASKDGLALYARSLAVALKPRNINVLTVFPGPTRTAHARRYSPDNSREQTRMSPDALAAQIYRATERRQRQLLPSLASRIVARLGLVTPRVTEWLMRKTIFEKL